MKFYCDLYMGESVRKKKEYLMQRLKEGKVLLGVYVITLPITEKNQLEVFDCMMLVQKVFHKADRLIVGIAAGHGEALDLVLEIAEDVYEKTGGADLRNYILNANKEQERLSDNGKQ